MDFIAIIVILAIGFLLYYIGKACYFYPAQNKEIKNLNDKIKNLKKEIYVTAIEFEKEKKELEEKCFKYDSIIKSSDPFITVADMYSDARTAIYDKIEYNLRHKQRPAYKASDEVRMLKEKTKMYISEFKSMLYRYEFLINTFPELKRYIDDYEALKSVETSSRYDEFVETRDSAIDYLSTEEWKKLNEVERNQLALDRYKQRTKSNWVIGIEYEMYIDYILRMNGYKTISNGSIKGLEDLGRDIIAFKTNKSGENVVYIIQCKNWSSKKEVHENVVCQIFGTTIEYKIKHKQQMFSKVVPVIYTTSPLSDMAIKFANELNVVVNVVKKGDYPMIKCNITSNGNKIYHLPFDQQYYRAEIKNPGEFYAWTVKEAVNSGFRRAFKYSGNKSN